MRKEGLSYRAIAAVLGVNAEWIRQIEVRGSAAREQEAALARFPDLKPGLALRLDARFPAAADVCAADDRELRSLRGMGEVQFARLRARYPHPHLPVRQNRYDPVAGELNNPMRSGARAFAPSREDYDK